MAKKSNTPQPIPTHAYVMRKPCGCATAVCVDLGFESWALVAAYQAEGLTTERMEMHTFEYGLILDNMGCTHKEGEEVIEPREGHDYTFLHMPGETAHVSLIRAGLVHYQPYANNKTYKMPVEHFLSTFKHAADCIECTTREELF